MIINKTFFYVCMLVLMSIAVNVFAENPDVERYDKLYMDVKNFDTIGYKAKCGYYLISQGPITKKGERFNEFSFAILGSSFFKVHDIINNKYYYTRNGDFVESEDGYLVTRDGYRLVPYIVIPHGRFFSFQMSEYNNFAINTYDYGAGQGVLKKIKITLYTYKNKKDITGDGLYFTIKDAIEDSNKDEIYQGSLERSTTQTIWSLIRLYAILKRNTADNHNFPNADSKAKIIELLLYNHSEIVKDSIPEEDDVTCRLIKNALPFFERTNR